jgi:hypothetical protein
MNFRDHPEVFQEEIPRKFPFLEVWLNKITTIHAGIKEQQAIEYYCGIM